MYFDFQKTDPLTVYRMMIQTVIPRPIAWTLTRNQDGKTFNLAPFSYFNVVTNDPPLVSLSIGRKDDDSIKDTRKNIESGRDFVIHIANSSNAEAVTKSSFSYPYGVSEVDELKLKLVADLPGTDMPRLEGPRAAFVCNVERVISVGTDEHGLILATVKLLYVDDQVVEQRDGGAIRFDAAKIDPLGRLGGNEYVLFGKKINIPRPEYKP